MASSPQALAAVDALSPPCIPRDPGNRPANPGLCLIEFNRKVRCCQEAGMDQETTALCKIAAYTEYLWCTGQIEKRKSLDLPCDEPAFGCGTDMACYYRRYPCCVYGIGCEPETE